MVPWPKGAAKLIVRAIREGGGGASVTPVDDGRVEALLASIASMKDDIRSLKGSVAYLKGALKQATTTDTE
jgi:hypothetical protein